MVKKRKRRRRLIYISCGLKYGNKLFDQMGDLIADICGGKCQAVWLHITKSQILISNTWNAFRDRQA